MMARKNLLHINKWFSTVSFLSFYISIMDRVLGWESDVKWFPHEPMLSISFDISLYFVGVAFILHLEKIDDSYKKRYEWSKEDTRWHIKFG
jgi:hypothetical protein